MDIFAKVAGSVRYLYHVLLERRIGRRQEQCWLEPVENSYAGKVEPTNEDRMED